MTIFAILQYQTCFYIIFGQLCAKTFKSLTILISSWSLKSVMHTEKIQKIISWALNLQVLMLQSNENSSSQHKVKNFVYHYFSTAANTCKEILKIIYSIHISNRYTDCREETKVINRRSTSNYNFLSFYKFCLVIHGIFF